MKISSIALAPDGSFIAYTGAALLRYNPRFGTWHRLVVDAEAGRCYSLNESEMIVRESVN